MANITDFKARFPEFKALGMPDATIQIYLDDAIDHLSEDAWGDCYDRAVYYYTAHIIAINQRRTIVMTNVGFEAATGKSGPITASSADGLSVSFASCCPSSNNEEDWFRQTSYGQDYLALRDECIGGASVTSCL